MGAPGSRSMRSCLASGSRRLPGGLSKTSEGLGVAHGDVGQHLAVELDLGQAQAVHQLAVAHALLAGGGVDPLDPQAAELALAVLAVAVGVGAGLEQLLLGPLVARVLLAAVALGPLERGAGLLARVYRTLDAAHLPSSSLARFASCGLSIFGSSSRRFRLALFFWRMCVFIACRARTLPFAVSLKRFFAPEWVFILGMTTA